MKIGDKVTIDPKWQEKYPNKINYGIDTWREYLGKIYTISSVDFSNCIYLSEDQHHFVWPKYMIMPIDKSTIKYYLWRREHESRR